MRGVSAGRTLGRGVASICMAHYHGVLNAAKIYAIEILSAMFSIIISAEWFVILGLRIAY